MGSLEAELCLVCASEDSTDGVELSCGFFCATCADSGVALRSVANPQYRIYVIGPVAPGTPPLGLPPGLTVSPRVGTVHVGVSRPRVGREAPGWGGPSWREPPRGGA